jgi:Undecaprenyl-phosphate glucose phosphotransferase
MTRPNALAARLLDVALVVSGAGIAFHIPLDDIAQRSFCDAFVAFAAAFALALFPAFGVYQSWRGRSKMGLAGQVSLAWLTVQTCALVLMFTLHRSDFVSRLWFACWTGTTGTLMIVSRMLVHGVLARMRHAGINLRRVAVVGRGAHALELVRKIDGYKAAGFRTAAVLDVSHDQPQLSGAISGLIPSVRAFAELPAFIDYIRGEDIHELWLALPLSEEHTIHKCVKELRDDLVNIRFMPDLRTVAMFDSTTIDLLGVPAINLVASPLSQTSQLQKEMFDRLFAAIALISLAPLLVAIAVAIKLSSRGPVLFTQKRKGADGRAFTIYKFRSMRLHTEKPGALRQATRHDARITRVGAFLRRTSLDELPHFFNVLRGDMSVVGPRPHALEHDDLYRNVVAGYIQRYRIKPGITGWAQINGFRGETDRIEKMERRVEHDLYYLGNWSFGLDMRIIAATILKVLKHSNAY